MCDVDTQDILGNVRSATQLGQEDNTFFLLVSTPNNPHRKLHKNIIQPFLRHRGWKKVNHRSTGFSLQSTDLAVMGFRDYLLCFVIAVVQHLVQAEYTSYDQLYVNGIRAYFDADWITCQESFENGISKYRKRNDGLKLCSLKCSGAKSESDVLSYVMEKASCMEKCESDEYGLAKHFLRVDEEVEQAFADKTFYTYLQYCYFQSGNLDMAAATTYTYTIYDPNDETMNGNLEYYMEHENVTDAMFRDLDVSPVVDSYYDAMEAYNGENYQDASKHFESSIAGFYDAEELCRAGCEKHYFYDASERREEHTKQFLLQIVDHYQQVLECSMRCPHTVVQVSKSSSLKDFLPMMYHYLQFSYFQSGDLSNAISCAKSYLLFFPEDEIMLGNLKFYSGKQDDADNLLPRKEAMDFQQRLVLQGSLLKYIYQSFGMKDYDPNILFPYKRVTDEDPNQTESLYADNGTDDPTTNEADGGSLTDDDDVDDSIGAISEDNTVPNAEDNIMPKAEDDIVPKAEDNTVVPDVAAENKQVDEIKKSRNMPVEDEYESFQQRAEDIIASKDAHNLRALEAKKRQAATFAAQDEVDEDVDIVELLKSPIGSRTVDSKNIVTVVDESSLSSKPVSSGALIRDQYKLLADPTHLKGETRFAVDGFLSDNECQSLMDLELSSGTMGDGYRGNASPHTNHETFQGIAILTAAKMAQQGKVPVSVVKLYFDIGELVRQQVQEFNHLDHLYIDYTHLVCRRAKRSDTERTDLSHPVHSDNCILHENGTCTKQYPAYTWRDYSAIVYLNEVNGGGEFIFTDSSARRAVVQVKPKCGRMVSFSAGKDSFHGVKAVGHGIRCALALWFTMDESHDEKQRHEAKRIIDNLAVKEEL